jgi:hypothetical protein
LLGKQFLGDTMAKRYHEEMKMNEMKRCDSCDSDGMIKENHSAIANLPQEVMIKPYPMTGPYMGETYDDTIRGIDMQMDGDDSKRRAHAKPRKA